MAAVKNMLFLLKNHPKQETEMVVSSLVNKLGDLSRKVSSQTVYGLRTVLQRRPDLKMFVVDFVETLLYR